MTNQQFSELLAFGYERAGVEFKGPGRRSEKNLFAKVVRAMLGMANRRDGGFVVMGVSDVAGKLSPIGFSADDLATWKYDDIAAGLAPYADPFLTFDFEIVVHDGLSFVVLAVQEFAEVPVLCSRDYQDVLRDGAVYVRSYRKPETSEVPSSAEMRDLLDLATVKRLQRFVSEAETAGLLKFTDRKVPSERELFEKQIKDLP